MKKKMSQEKATKLLVKILVSLLVWILGIAMLVPFIWMLSTSFKGMNDVFSFPIEWLPKNPTLKGYIALFTGNVSFFTYFFNSIKVSVIAVAGTFFSCTMAGYAYAKSGICSSLITLSRSTQGE